VTVLFADLKGSMELLADRDPEDARSLLDPVLERMMEAVHRYEGTVNQVMGDGIMALFGAPLAHEDHAVRACYAALDMQAAIRRYAEEIRRTHGLALDIRVGLNSGEVVVRAIGSDLRMDYTAVGQTTHLAARMEQLARPGSTLLTAHTLRLAEGHVRVTPLGPVPVKGLDAPIEVYEVAGAGARRSRLDTAATRGLTRFVGREGELEQLRQALGRAAAGHGQVVAVPGEPGVGKSRLVWEVTHSDLTHGWLIVHAGSVSYGKATPYLPVIDLLKSYFQLEDRDGHRQARERVLGKLLALDPSLEPSLPAFLALLDIPADHAEWQALDPPQRRQRTLDAVKRLLLRESQVRPVLVVFEDLHWIDSETQAVLDGLVESLPASRALLLVNYRPEYEHRWGGRACYSQLRLDPLPEVSAGALLQAVVGDDPALEPLERLLVERTGGNPFFLEESVRTLAESGVLVGERGGYRLAGAVDGIRVPATVHAVLAARIDRLPPEDKRLLQTASVIGKDVPFALLHAVSGTAEDRLRRHMTHLQAAEFLYESRLFPDLAYTFKHALTHEVTYAGLLQAQRRELHRRVGEALEERAQHRPEERYDLLARHFAESGDLAKGLDYSVRAAEKAARLFAHDEALSHFGRAHACAAALNLSDRLAAIEEAVGDVHLRRGDFDLAVASCQTALARALPADRQAALRFKIGRVYGQFADQRGLPFLHAALEELSPDTQRRELAEATAFVGRYHHYAAQHRQAIEVVERARRLAEPLDDAETLTPIYAYLAGAHQHLARFHESMEWARRCLALGERADHAPALALGHEFLAEDLAYLGRWEESLACSARSRDVSARIGAQARLAWAEHNRATALYGKGALAEAARASRLALPLAEATGERRLAIWIHALLSRAETDMGRDEAAHHEARAAIAAADALGDRVLRSFAQVTLGYFHLQRREWGAAAEGFERAAALLAGTDQQLARLAGLASWGEALCGQQRLGEAAAVIAQASELAEAARSDHYRAVAGRVRGRLLGLRARWDDAARVLDEASAALDALGSRLELARALHLRGLTRRAQGDRAAGFADLDRARTLFIETGAQRDHEQVRTALEDRGAPCGGPP
jgi:class 3 adenylate cyclase